MMELFHKSAFQCSRNVTELYSTSFTLGIKALKKEHHDAIFAIYGFVRYADEIVDTFHEYNKKKLLETFRRDTLVAIEEGISLNPILHAFQLIVNKYQIDMQLIDTFLHSMEMDLEYVQYKQDNYAEYIYGSAEVVGLMCLKVFCAGQPDAYDSLKYYAQKLGAAFQKVNFLRDMQSDFKERGRVYFPGVDFENFCESEKMKIEQEIQSDFEEAYKGICKLPHASRFGVYLAYVYYLRLFRKIKQTPAAQVMQTRIRVSNAGKLALWVKSYFNSNVFGVLTP
ncbi:MAG: phytoene/squalene synthase family protein [Chitinophagales bacterium]